MTVIFHSGTVAPTSTFLIVTVMLPQNDPVLAKFVLAFVTAGSFTFAFKGAGVRPEATG